MAPESSFPAELIDVRNDERFDERRLAEWLRGRLDGSERPLRVRQFGGGHANLTYLLRYGEGDDAREYVLRRPPLGPVAARSHDMQREYRALSKLWQSFPPAPRAYLYCDDKSLIGADFLVMERRHGVVIRSVVPPEFGGGEDPVANRKLSEVVIDTLVDFHAVDPAPIGLDSLGKPEGFLARQVKGWLDRFERAKTSEQPVAEEVASWLLANLPESPPPTLVHNDWKLDNMAVAHDDPGRCVAVYDWDMCTIGDPLCDVGTLLGLWSNRGEGLAGSNPMPTQTPGFMTRQQAAARYAERSGRDVSKLDYYVVFGTFKMGVVLQQIYVRFHRGQTQDTRFAGLGKLADGLFRLAAERRPYLREAQRSVWNARAERGVREADRYSWDERGGAQCFRPPLVDSARQQYRATLARTFYTLPGESGNQARPVQQGPSKTFAEVGEFARRSHLPIPVFVATSSDGSTLSSRVFELTPYAIGSDDWIMPWSTFGIGCLSWLDFNLAAAISGAAIDVRNMEQEQDGAIGPLKTLRAHPKTSGKAGLSVGQIPVSRGSGMGSNHRSPCWPSWLCDGWRRFNGSIRLSNRWRAPRESRNLSTNTTSLLEYHRCGCGV